jgi:hypothetical protein
MKNTNNNRKQNSGTKKNISKIIRKPFNCVAEIIKKICATSTEKTDGFDSDEEVTNANKAVDVLRVNEEINQEVLELKKSLELNNETEQEPEYTWPLTPAAKRKILLNKKKKLKVKNPSCKAAKVSTKKSK